MAAKKKVQISDRMRSVRKELRSTDCRFMAIIKTLLLTQHVALVTVEGKSASGQVTALVGPSSNDNDE